MSSTPTRRRTAIRHEVLLPRKKRCRTFFAEGQRETSLYTNEYVRRLLFHEKTILPETSKLISDSSQKDTVLQQDLRIDEMVENLSNSRTIYRIRKIRIPPPTRSKYVFEQTDEGILIPARKKKSRERSSICLIRCL